MGPVIVFVIWGQFGVAIGGVLFVVLALLSRFLPWAYRRTALIVSGAVSTICGLAIAAALPTLFFIGSLLPDNPKADFHAIFGRDPPEGIAILKSHAAAGTDYSDVAVQIRVSETDLRALVAGWEPGPVSVGALPANDALDATEACPGARAFLDNSGHRTLEYSAVLYCPDSSIARAVYASID